MIEPILAANSTWFAPTVSSVTRASITEIEIKDNYTPDVSVTVTDSWDASAAKDNSVMCYVIGTKLIIAGNGSGCIYANADSFSVFSDFKIANSIELGLLDTSRATTMKWMFYNCRAVQTLDLGQFDTSNVANMNGMFMSCYALKTLDVNMFDTSNVTDMCYMFRSCRALTTLDLSGFNTSKVTDMHDMFSGCQVLTNLDVTNFNTSNVTNMDYMFSEDVKLTQLDVSKFDTSNCQYMSFMFYNCSPLKEIDVSNWDVSKVEYFDHFAAHANLKRKGMERWNISSAVNLNAVFHNCTEEELDLSGWDVSKNQFFCQMFENSPNLKRIKGLDKWDTSSGLGFDGMFERCYNLEEVDLSSFNTSKAKNNIEASWYNGHQTTTLQNMFLSCNNLKKVKLGPNFSINGDGTNTTAANKLILPTPSTDYIAGADGNWYAFNGDPYAPNAIPDRTADIYFASFPLCQDQDVIVKNGSMIDTAKAIREKNGTTTKYNPSQFGEAIRALN